MKLADEAEALAYDTAFWLLGYEDEAPKPIATVARSSLELCGKLRALAIIALLTGGGSEKFLHNLARSGRVRETFLRRARAALASRSANDVPIPHFASSRLDGFFDAVASSDLELAGRIAWQSPREWQPSIEYEDDFCYAQVLHRLLHGVEASGAYQALLERFEAALQGVDDARLALARALVERSQPAFDTAFEALLETRRSVIAADLARFQLEEPAVVAERQVFVEGLAVLRLAGHLGLQTASDYLYCPSNARALMQTPVPE